MSGSEICDYSLEGFADVLGTGVKCGVVWLLLPFELLFEGMGTSVGICLTSRFGLSSYFGKYGCTKTAGLSSSMILIELRFSSRFTLMSSSSTI